MDARVDPSQDSDPHAGMLAAYAAGDRRAARDLVLALTPRAFGQAQRMLQDRAQAEDVAQEALVRLWRAAPDWQSGQARVTTWLYRVVANLCLDRLRARRPMADLDAIDAPADPSPGAVAQMQDAARLRALSDAMAQLPDRQAQAVALRHLEGLTNPQIADVMGIGVEAVESLTARGKRALAAILAGRKDELGYDDDQT
jgi:RNA polymerase sigma factor (sigma-70 family)